MKKTDAAVVKQAKQQLGLIGRAQALALGMSSSAIERRRAAKDWVKVARGVYRLAGTPETDHQRVLAACLALGPSAMASHATAGWLWGLDGFQRVMPKPISVSVPHGTRGKVKGVAVHQRRDLGEACMARFGTIPATDLPRTLVDLAADGDLPRLERALDSAWRKNHELPALVTACVDALGAKGRTGIHALLALVRGRQPRATDSAHEVDVLRRIRLARLPEPTLQHEVRDARGLISRADFAWVDQKVALFADGWAFHGGRQDFDRDHEQRERLAAFGWTPVAVTPRLVQDGSWLRALARHLRRTG